MESSPNIHGGTAQGVHVQGIREGINKGISISSGCSLWFPCCRVGKWFVAMMVAAAVMFGDGKSVNKIHKLDVQEKLFGMGSKIGDR